MRPEFLGLTLIVGALVGMAFAGYQPDADAPSAPQQRSEYVGLDPASLPLVDCNPDCQADALFAAWKAAHPNAKIVTLEAHHEGNRLVGYTVVYLE